jgi:peptidoglycan/LPS O-acetylase OafA/YrhL
MTESSPRPVRAATTSAVRPEIQGLRAAAVMLVVIFHLWPSRLTGGYAGVDVFFAISGFLITAHLVREVERTGTVALASFWARRARRLLPASMLVLLVSAIGVLVWVPVTYWQQFLREAAAATTYVLNWLLTRDAVDYLAAENAASPVQHYWSLSVEEQFYLVWPLLIILAVSLARSRRRTSDRTLIIVVLAIVTGASLAYSIYETATSPAAAYFVTTTRAWEFGAGGLLAVIGTASVRTSPTVRALVAWLGWAGIALTAFTFTPATPFPGYLALLPVLGTLAVIWAGTPDRAWAPTALVRLRPVQALGDVSYAVYLWHWPLIVIVPFALGHDLGTVNKVLILGVTLGLAVATKLWVEDPLRSGARWKRSRPRSTFAVAAAGMAVILVLSGAGYAVARTSQNAGTAQADSLIKGATDCLGAAASDPALEQPCENPDLEGVLLPELAGIADDTGDAFSCYDTAPGAALKPCTFGSTDAGALKVAIVGDSHAAMLLPGLRDQLKTLNWSVDTYVSRGCVWSWVDSADAADECYDRRHALQERFEQGDKYDVILVTARRDPTLAETAGDPRAELLAKAWAPVIARGTQVIALADNPMLPEGTLDCLIDAPADSAETSSCATTQEQAFSQSDPLPEAVELAGTGAHLVDLSDFYCWNGSCPLVIGHVLVYRDTHHITATFSRTLAPFLVRGINTFIDQG